MPLPSARIRDFEHFPTVAPSWRGRQPAPGHLMQTYEWNAACAQTFRAGGDLELISVADDVGGIGIAPLVRRRRGLVSRLELLGAAELGEPAGIYYQDENALQLICRELVTSGLPTVLARVARDGPMPPALSRAARGRGRVVVINSLATPYLQLANGWDAILDGLSARRRHDLRRARRLLEREGRVSVEITRPDEIAAGELLEVAFDVEARSWKKDNDSALRVKPLLAAFYQEYAKSLVKNRQLVMCFLSVAGEPVAMQIGAVHARKFWLLKIGYDERRAKASPGMQLLAESLRWACAEGLDTYEFLGSEESWLRVWRPRMHHCCTLVYYPYSLAGVGALVSDAASSGWRRVARTMGMLKRRGGGQG